MKMRQGFVSNSSSSSFVVLGFIPTGDEEGKYEDDWENSEILHDDGRMIVGKRIASGSDYEFDDTNTDVGDLVETQHRIAKQYGVELARIKLYTGVYAC